MIYLIRTNKQLLEYINFLQGFLATELKGKSLRFFIEICLDVLVRNVKKMSGVLGI